MKAVSIKHGASLHTEGHVHLGPAAADADLQSIHSLHWLCYTYDCHMYGQVK